VLARQPKSNTTHLGSVLMTHLTLKSPSQGGQWRNDEMLEQSEFSSSPLHARVSFFEATRLQLLGWWLSCHAQERSEQHRCSGLQRKECGTFDWLT